MTEIIISVAIFLLIQVFATFFWLGKWMGRINTKLNALCNDISHITVDVRKIHDRLNDYGQRISRLEGRLDSGQERD